MIKARYGMNSCRLLLTALAVLVSMPSNICYAGEVVRYGIRKDYFIQYPDDNGIYWTHAISDKIFTDAGYQRKVIRRPARRMPLSLARDEVDIIYSVDSTIANYQTKFLRAKLPTIMLAYYIYYNHRDDWQPVWPPDLTFKNKIGRSAHSADSLRDQYQLNISQAANFDVPVKMVNKRRVDYSIEHEGGMFSVAPGLVKPPEQGFTRKPLFRKPVYAYFQDTKQGATLRAVYNQGQLLMYQNAEYGKVYFHDTPVYIGSHPVDDVVFFINQHFPELKIPRQVIPHLPH